jgi:hypothetical protein
MRVSSTRAHTERPADHSSRNPNRPRRQRSGFRPDLLARRRTKLRRPRQDRRQLRRSRQCWSRSRRRLQLANVRKRGRARVILPQSTRVVGRCTRRNHSHTILVSARIVWFASPPLAESARRSRGPNELTFARNVVEANPSMAWRRAKRRRCLRNQPVIHRARGDGCEVSSGGCTRRLCTRPGLPRRAEPIGAPRVGGNAAAGGYSGACAGRAGRR